MYAFKQVYLKIAFMNHDAQGNNASELQLRVILSEGLSVFKLSL